MKKINICALLIITAILASCGKSGETTLSQLTQDTQPADVLEQPESEAMPETGVIFVYVCGSVQNPGVYELSEGSRVCDALDAAGGFSENADQKRINLAGILRDGDMIFFPEIGEALENGASDYVQGGSGDAAGRLININTAGEDALCTLPGIGSSKAQAIIKYREEHGSFKDIREIMNVSGIGENLFKQIEDLICV